jgi:hypothetical protein
MIEDRQIKVTNQIVDGLFSESGVNCQSSTHAMADENDIWKMGEVLSRIK